MCNGDSPSSGQHAQPVGLTKTCQVSEASEKFTENQSESMIILALESSYFNQNGSSTMKDKR